MTNTISETEYKALRSKIDAWQATAKTMQSQGIEFLDRTDVAKVTAEPTNEELASVEVYEFVANPPESYFAYISEKDGEPRMTTWTGDTLGTAYFASLWRDNFGGLRFPITVKAINGKEYYGTYYKSSGDYCRIKAKKVKG